MDMGKRPKDDWTIGVNNTALVVIDMQRAFVDDGAPYLCPGAKEIVPGISKLAAICRKAGIPVIWVKANRRADLSDSDLVQDLAPKPEDDEMERPPCFAILTPAPAATKDAHVDMLKVLSPSPPVPQVSTTSSSRSTGVRLSLNT